jgi:predicted TIM-barrel fold metal-dependent hydrolase
MAYDPFPVLPVPCLATPFADAPAAAVDSHFHIFAAHQSVPGARYQPGYSALLADWAALAQPHQVRRGVLVQPSFLGVDNRMLLSALGHNPALRGVAVVAPLGTAQQLQHLAQMHVQGVRGIRLNLAGLSHDVQPWCRVPALWDGLLRLGWHLQLHTGVGELPAVLQPLLPHLPADLPLVFDHFAKPKTADADDETVQLLGALAKRGRRLFIKLSAPYRLGDAEARTLAQRWLQMLGPTQLLWGSDWPCTNEERWANYADLRTALDALLDDTAVRQAVLAGNPHRLYV